MVSCLSFSQWTLQSYSSHNTKSSNTWKILAHYQAQLSAWDAALASFGPQVCVLTLRTYSLRFYLNDAGLFLTTANFSVSADHIICPNKEKSFVSVGLDSLSPTNQKPQIPNTKYRRNASGKSFEGILKFPSETS